MTGALVPMQGDRCPSIGSTQVYVSIGSCIRYLLWKNILELLSFPQGRMVMVRSDGVHHQHVAAENLPACITCKPCGLVILASMRSCKIEKLLADAPHLKGTIATSQKSCQVQNKSQGEKRVSKLRVLCPVTSRQGVQAEA
jgi:hypothetical protein